MRIAALAAVLLFTTACTAAPTAEPAAAPAEQAAEAVSGPVVGMANPASVACGDLFGGELSIVDGPDGQYGVCTLPDGRVCEEWVLFQDHRCATGRDAPSIGAPVTPTEPRRDSRSAKTGG